MSKYESSSSEVVRLVERCLDVMERHDDSRVDELLAEYPEYAAAVRERLELLARTGLLSFEPEPDAPEFPETLGEFRLLEPLGRGGMGVVYRAHQESLGRDVALKLIGPGQLFVPGARERFRREVEAVARLDHPGIVSIHTVGEERGIPYFAMEYVDGLSLDQLLARLGTQHPEKLTGAELRISERNHESSSTENAGRVSMNWIDACFSIVLEIGVALKHAHERGVHHRDIKPSNVMITTDGRARVLDFGLAWSEGASPITRSGSQMGSLPYMAPEQVRGDSSAVGPRTDVYALGVTLYEMLTLRSPHGAETVQRTRERILDGRPVPIERLNSNVPWDAETVCLTAMDPDPERRYQTMTEMVEDVRRFLLRQSIHARRPGAWLRGKRWVQRAPARAAAVALGVLLVVGGPAAYAVFANAARADLHASFEREADARRRAEQSLRGAIAAIDEMILQGSDDEFAAKPGTDPVRRALLERAVILYEDLLERESDSETVAAHAIGAQTRLALLHRELGNLDAAIEFARRALEASEREDDALAAHATLGSKARFALVEALYGAGDLEGFRRGCEEAFAEPELEGTTAQFEQSRRRVILSQWLASVLQREGDVDGALALVDESIELCDELLEHSPSNYRVLADLALGLQLKAYFSGFHSRTFDYDADFERAVELLDRSIELKPSSPMLRGRLAGSLSKWAHLHITRRRMAEATSHAERANDLLERLVDEFPLREVFALNYLANIQRLSWSIRFNDDMPGALDVLGAGLELGREALARFPESDSIAFYLAMITTELARLIGERGESEYADEFWPEAQEYWERLLRVPEPQLRHTIQVGTFYDNLARHELLRGELGDSERSARKAIEWHEKMLVRTGSDEHASRLALTLPLLAQIQIARGMLEQAMETLEQGVSDGYVDSAALAKPPIASGLGERQDYRMLIERTSG